MVRAQVLAAIGISHQRKKAFLSATQFADDVLNLLCGFHAEIRRSVIEEMQSFRHGWIRFPGCLILIADLQNAIDQWARYLLIPYPRQQPRTFRGGLPVGFAKRVLPLVRSRETL